MGITGAEKCYFVVWTPHGMNIEIIKFDKLFFENIKEDFNTYYNDFYLKTLSLMHSLLLILYFNLS